MLLLFVAGVMNLLWVALIAGCVLVEKVAPAGHWVSYAIGLIEVGCGVLYLVR
jgi:predicted metal-binding membrane protein